MNSSRYSWAFFGRIACAAGVSFIVMLAVLIITQKGWGQKETQLISLAAAFSGVSALASLRYRHLTPCVFVPVTLVLAITTMMKSGLPPKTALFSLPGMLLAIVAGLRPITFKYFAIAIATAGAAALLLRYGYGNSFATKLDIMIGTYAVSTIAGSISIEFGHLIHKTTKDLYPFARPVMSFLCLYCLVAFAYALVYGTVFFTDRAAFACKLGTDEIDLLKLFQWSITVSATAGTLELIPEGKLVRLIFVSQLLSNVFLVSVFVSKLLQDSPSKPKNNA